MARPTKFSPDRQKRICDGIRVGLHLEQAAEWAGIAPSTFYRWMDQGKNASSGRWREFWEAVRAAELEAEMSAIATIRAAFSGEKRDWHAAEAFLKRRFPERWGTTTRLVGADGGPVQIQTTREQALEDGKERARHLRAV